MCRNVETGERPLNPVTMSALASNADECHMVCKDTNNYPGAIGSEFFLQGGRETCECVFSHDGLQVPQDPLPEEYSLYLCGDEEGNLISWSVFPICVLQIECNIPIFWNRQFKHWKHDLLVLGLRLITGQLSSYLFFNFWAIYNCFANLCAQSTYRLCYFNFNWSLFLLSNCYLANFEKYNSFA